MIAPTNSRSPTILQASLRERISPGNIRHLPTPERAAAEAAQQGRMVESSQVVAEYHRSRRPLVRELGVQPWRCEFWPVAEVVQYNTDYEVEKYAPGYFGFGCSGGGEMFAISPVGSIVCLPFIGMSGSEARRGRRIPCSPSSCVSFAFSLLRRRLPIAVGRSFPKKRAIGPRDAHAHNADRRV